MENRRERKKQQTRTALLDAAMALFFERGISGTRVGDITERIDLGKGAFYNYFPSKDALIAELVARGVQTFRESYLSRVNGSAQVGDRVDELSQLHSSFLDEHPQYALLLHQARGLLLLKGTPLERLREVFVEYLHEVGLAILPPDHRAEVSSGDLHDVAAALVGGTSGYRSFSIAAGLPRSRSTAQSVLRFGIPDVIKQRLNGV